MLKCWRARVSDCYPTGRGGSPANEMSLRRAYRPLVSRASARQGSPHRVIHSCIDICHVIGWTSYSMTTKNSEKYWVEALFSPVPPI